MALSAAMQARYTSQVDVDWWDALIISHPTGGSFFLNNSWDVQRGTFWGKRQTFQPIPFEFTLPKLDGEGQQDLQLSICNVGSEMQQALARVKQQPATPIKVYVTQYIIGNDNPQYDPPWELTLTDITLTRQVMTGTATRTDVFNAPFPRQLYRIDKFPALNRR